jgi:hypothetical protein
MMALWQNETLQWYALQGVAISFVLMQFAFYRSPRNAKASGRAIVFGLLAYVLIKYDPDFKPWLIVAIMAIVIYALDSSNTARQENEKTPEAKIDRLESDGHASRV